jgi:hypothetical protein
MEVCLKLDNIKRENRPYAEVSSYKSPLIKFGDGATAAKDFVAEVGGKNENGLRQQFILLNSPLSHRLIFFNQKTGFCHFKVFCIINIHGRHPA